MLTATVPPYSEVIQEHILKVGIGNEISVHVFAGRAAHAALASS